ncbi:carboxymuconolactone decarboxylase family protein [Campylobacter sp. TTU-622]|uniref:carboxymuconolactone decarboxylase family protein n=1 Tax=unclassified Campylobacter TaxID=2593542 RepID=UPI001907C7B6|nr:MULTISPECIES: carboxymuconolactone decarboxylase family protein [unclassified Campylobacter]MBK1972917.1 carboxymuconolactone decarboxylase family protein [Campylobacter sp. TTU-622]MBK1991899.1 carboxymuconolactone decarboxylase family protein [Campylobacter sp. 2018MI34]
MQRRKFFKNTMILAAGTTFINSALSAKENDSLMQNDPEFYEIFNYFSKVEVTKYNKLDKQNTHLVKLAAIIANGGSLDFFKEYLNIALAQNINPVAIKELIYQSVPYLGFSKVYKFLELCNKIFKESNISLPLKNQGTTTKENRYEEGLKLQVYIFKEAILKGNEDTPEDMKHIREFLSSNCFGDYYTRKGLDLKTRELLTFVFLASLGGCENQLKGHIQGNFNMKNNRDILISTLTQICPFIGYPKTLNALNLIEETSKK